MSATEDLFSADTMMIGPITFHRSLPLGFGETDTGVSGFCLTKGRGSISITIDARSFGIPLGEPLPLTFTGSSSTNGTVTWTLDQPVSVRVFGIGVSRIHGQIVARVTETMITTGTACDPSQARIFRATLASVPASSTITANTDVGPAVISNIAFGATLGELLDQLAFSVDVRANHWQSNACGERWQLVGSSVTFSAYVEHLHAIGNTITYRFGWELPEGVTALGPTDQRDLRVRLDRSGPITLACNVAVESDIQGTGTHRGSRTFAVLTAEEAEQRNGLCRLRQAVFSVSRAMGYVLVVKGAGAGGQFGRYRIVDPLWDPAPDQLRTILQREAHVHELHSARKAAEQLAREAQAFVAQTDKLLGQRELQLKKLEKTQFSKP